MTERIAVAAIPFQTTTKKTQKTNQAFANSSYGNAVQLSKTSTSTPWFFLHAAARKCVLFVRTQLRS